jgi:hypothetical protein
MYRYNVADASLFSELTLSLERNAPSPYCPGVCDSAPGTILALSGDSQMYERERPRGRRIARANCGAGRGRANLYASR